MSDIKTLVKDQYAVFEYYRDSSLWYSIGDFLFPVPIDDIGNATFLAKDKAILFMRYIKKQLKVIEDGKA